MNYPGYDDMGQTQEPRRQRAAPNHPPRYQPLPYQQEAIFVNAPAPRSEESTSIGRLSVPFILVLIGGIALVGLTWGAATQFNDIKNAVERLEARITGLTDTLANRVRRLESAARTVERTRWSKDDHDAWCKLTEAVNKGWRCPDYKPVLSRTIPAFTESWAPTTSSGAD